MEKRENRRKATSVQELLYPPPPANCDSGNMPLSPLGQEARGSLLHESSWHCVRSKRSERSEVVKVIQVNKSSNKLGGQMSTINVSKLYQASIQSSGRQCAPRVCEAFKQYQLKPNSRSTSQAHPSGCTGQAPAPFVTHHCRIQA